MLSKLPSCRTPGLANSGQRRGAISGSLAYNRQAEPSLLRNNLSQEANRTADGIFGAGRRRDGGMVTAILFPRNGFLELARHTGGPRHHGGLGVELIRDRKNGEKQD